MRSKALCFLLSLSLMFCVGYGSSITASAASLPLESVPFYNSAYKSMQFRIRDSSGNNFNFTGDFDESVFGSVFTLDKDYNLSNLFYRVNSDTYGFEYAFNHDSFDYYLALSVGSARPNTFSVSSFGVIGYDIGGISTNYFCSNIVFLSNSNVGYNGFTVVGKLPENTSSRLSYIRCGGSFFIGAGNVSVESFVYQVPKNSSSEQVASIIQAIQNQTSELGGKIDSAADDIQQSIEDQYSGEPGSSFPIDDIITQHNEKMGVLSFGSDTLMQVLGLLSPDQSLSSELVFPSMSLTIAGQRNKVQLWPEYRFDLNELKQHWPNFVGLMQSLTTALVWIFVLRYCYRVFEKYFLAGGGN